MSLRKNLVRLAYEKKELRPHLLPLIKNAGNYIDWLPASAGSPFQEVTLAIDKAKSLREQLELARYITDNPDRMSQTETQVLIQQIQEHPDWDKHTAPKIWLQSRIR